LRDDEEGDVEKKRKDYAEGDVEGAELLEWDAVEGVDQLMK
jgi:hypothetical protein